KKLNELGGGDSQGNSKEVASLYPSIRKLPVLGVTYADLYMKSRMQATIFELLTQQYELARVQEAKEIPSVKVLDTAAVPTEKSFPPRLLITLLGTMAGLGVAVVWVLWSRKWEEAEPDDPRKIFAQEVFATISARVPKFSKNGSGSNSIREKFWTKT